MTLRSSYRLIAPFYDALVGRMMDPARRRSLEGLARNRARNVLIVGIGTGLDLPHLPTNRRYVALDLSAHMMARAQPRTGDHAIAFVEGDAQRLPFGDETFDAVVLHLIVAIVPSPTLCLAEASRILRPGGHAFVLDKFLRRGERAWIRRAVNPLTRRIATRTDVVLEDTLAAVPGLALREDRPALAGGWFRLLDLEKRADDAIEQQ